MGSGAGIGQKPDDWLTVPLCGGSSGFDGCHSLQHRTSEPNFWQLYYAKTGQSVTELIDELINASPKKAEIRAIQREREQ
jgi:hypothetical protein